MDREERILNNATRRLGDIIGERINGEVSLFGYIPASKPYYDESYTFPTRFGRNMRSTYPVEIIIPELGIRFNPIF